MKRPRTATVPFRQINFDDTTFTLTSFTDQEPNGQLIRSMEEVGLLHPPIIAELATGPSIIVSGRQRLLICRDHLGQATCPCLIMPEESDKTQLWTLALEENLSHAPLSPLQTAVFIQKVLRVMEPEQVAERFLPRLGLPPHARQLDNYLPLADLEEPMAVALHQGHLDRKAALLLGALSFRDRFALFEMITSLGLSSSNQKKLISICTEMEKRQSTSVMQILAAPEITEIQKSQANAPQKAANLMRYLGRLASPRLSEAEEEFKELVRELRLPAGASLSHASFFEKDDLSLHLDFSTRIALVNFWSKVSHHFTAGRHNHPIKK